ncbi:hypothetical protein MRX96_019633 [Rhipicephalus microplus]
MVERALEQLKKDNAAKEEQRGNGDSKPKEREEETNGGVTGSPEDNGESRDSQERSDGTFSDQESKDTSSHAPEVCTRPSEIPRTAIESLSQATQEMSGPQ